MTVPRQHSQKQQGVALITTIIVVAVLAVVAVAFMQSTTVDRMSSRSVANYMRAKLAADAGIAMASTVLRKNTTNDTFIVVLNTNRQLFIGNGVTNPVTSTDFSYEPLFTTSTSLTSSVVAITSAVVPNTNVPGGVILTNEMPGGLVSTSPVVSWVYLTATNSAGLVLTNARFAFWVEDLGGKLDLSVVGTNTSDPAARRPTGTNPAEIALWSVLATNANSAASAGAAGNALVAARSNILTAATARVLDPSLTTNSLASLAANMRHDTNEPELIPFGFGYADQGRPKYNLNTNISAAGVNAIATIINQNLPQFVQRAGGYTNSAAGGATNTAAYAPFSYLQTIAANIIDYADTDSNPTTDGTALVVGRVRPVYRGVDSYPFVNELAKRYRLLSNVITTNSSGVVGRGLFIETTDFFELWNPASQAANGIFTFVSVHGQGINAGFLSSSFASPTWASNELGPVIRGVTTNQFPVALAPNAFAVRSNPPTTNFFFIPSTNTIATIRALEELTNSGYYSQWNNVFYDAALGGILRLEVGNLGSNATNRANMPSFISRLNATTFADPAVGDPRSTIYLSRPVDATAYDSRSSFGGRNDRRIDGQPYGQVSPVSWPDSGHDSPSGNIAGSHATAPTSVALATYSNIPPSRISNAGSYSNITELGAIFDPIQWRVPALASWQGKWTNLPSGAASVADNGFGGGNSLRIGRAEHPRFTNTGLRAAQLLDIFAVGSTNSAGMVLRRPMGRVNLNTADPASLRALAAGVAHASDAALRPGGTNFFPPANALRAFSQGVTNYRAAKPFFSVSELASISTNGNTSQWPTNAVFGNTNATVANVLAWNDAAAEEWFSKIHSLASVRSRNFMVHVVGQSLGTNNPNLPLSTFRAASQVYLAPQRSAAGLTTNARVQVIQTWGL